MTHIEAKKYDYRTIKHETSKQGEYVYLIQIKRFHEGFKIPLVSTKFPADKLFTSFRKFKKKLGYKVHKLSYSYEVVQGIKVWREYGKWHVLRSASNKTLDICEEVSNKHLLKFLKKNFE